MVRKEGVEPSSPKAYGPEPYVFANFTTSAEIFISVYPKMRVVSICLDFNVKVML